jgi:hypothetical protein
MQKYAGIYLLQNHSTCFGCLSHPSSGVHKTVTAASGTGHSIWETTFLQRGLEATYLLGPVLTPFQYTHPSFFAGSQFENSFLRPKNKNKSLVPFGG